MTKPKTKHTISICFIFVASVQFLLFTISAEAVKARAGLSDGGVARILYINSYHHGYAWSDDIESGLRTVLETQGPRIELSTEYLDTRRFPNPGLQYAVADLMADKFAGYPFDLIVVSDNAAFDFSIMHRERLFSGIPIVFCGYNNFRPEMLRNKSHITGVNEEITIDETVAMALEVHPETETLVFITSTKDAGSKRISEVAEQSIFPEYSTRFNLIVLKDAALDEIRHRLEHLPPETLVFLPGQVRDMGIGRALTPVENGRLVSGISPFPAYTFWNFHLNTGVIGGHILSGYKQGTEAADIVLRILGGTPVDEIPVVMASPAEEVFDFKVMKRFGITEAILPKGARVLNRPAVTLTDAEQSWLIRNPRIKLLAPVGQAPFFMQDSDGSSIGILPDLFGHLSRAIGQELEFEVLEAASSPNAGAKGKDVFGHSSIVETPVNKSRYLLTDPYIKTGFFIFTRKNNLDAIRTPSDLKGKKVALRKTARAHRAWLDKIGGIEKVVVNSPLEQMQKVSAGEVDAMIGYATYPYLINKYMMGDLVIAFITESGWNICIGIDPEYPILHGILNKAIATLGEHTKNEIRIKWTRISRDFIPQIELTRDEIAWLKAHPVIRFSNEMDWPPFDFAESGNPKGYSIDYIRLLEKKIPGVEFRFINGYTWSELVEMLKERKIDVLHCSVETEKRKAFALFTAPYIHLLGVIVTRKDRSDITSMEDLHEKSLAVIKGSMTIDSLNENYPGIKLMTVSSPLDALMAVSVGEVDAYIGENAAVKYLIHNYFIDNVRESAYPRINSTGYSNRSPRRMHPRSAGSGARDWERRFPGNLSDSWGAGYGRRVRKI